MTAINDLGLLGVFDENKLIELRKHEQERLDLLRKQREEKKAAEWVVEHEHQSDYFYYIAGYTPGGAPYGVTWEEMGLEPWEEME